jgi:phospholipid/cholesterol/gamma-HCH transport system substrate-binding protein
MEAESRYAAVGAAVLLLVGVLVAAVLWLKGVAGQDTARYAIHFERQALDGLDVGASVSLRGIQVGRVDDYALAGELGERVRVEISIDNRTPVRTGTVAVVTRNLVTGLARIALVNREPVGEPLVEVPPGDSLPVIAEGQSDMDAITGRVNEVGEVASQALTNLAQLLSAENRAALMDTVGSLRALADGLNQRLDTMERSLATVAAAAERTGVAARELGTAGQRIAGVVENTSQRLDGALVQSQQTLASVDAAMLQARDALARMTAAVDAVERQTVSTAQRLEGTVAGVDDQLRAVVADLRSSTEVAARTLDRLADPRARLLGPSEAQLGPGEVLP